VFFPVILESIQELEVVNIGNIDSQQTENQLIQTQIVTLTVFDSGYYVIPPFQFKAKLPSSNTTDSIATEPFMVAVYSIEIDTTQAIKAIKEPLGVPMTWQELWLYYVIGALTILVIVLGYLWMKKKNTIPEAPKRRIINRPPHEIALKKLNQLSARKLWQKGEIKAYYTQLTEIIREYIEYRYIIPALESTSDEILREISSLLPSEPIQEVLSELLREADMVKFAKGKPLPDVNERCMKMALEFVNETKVLPEDKQKEVARVS